MAPTTRANVAPVSARRRIAVIGEDEKREARMRSGLRDLVRAAAAVGSIGVHVNDAGDGTVAGVIHVHTNRSDGRSSPDEVAQAAAHAGLTFLIFTDHGDAPARRNRSYVGASGRRHFPRWRSSTPIRAGARGR